MTKILRFNAGCHYNSLLPVPEKITYRLAMGIKATLETAHKVLSDAGINHALIGGIALATMGIHRATEDVDFLIDGDMKDRAREVLVRSGFQLRFETPEVLHFEGIGRLDLLPANRPLSKKMVEMARPIAPHTIPAVTPESLIGLKIQDYKNDGRHEFQDKADIKSIIDKGMPLDWTIIKQYADLFGEWEFIETLRNKK